jgi:hypothetical protein
MLAPLSTFETVEMSTLAAAATSRIVGPPARKALGFLLLRAADAKSEPPKDGSGFIMAHGRA